MRTYDDFKEYLRDGRTDVEPGRPLRNNTRVYYHGEAPGQEIYILYHTTEILCFHPDGTIDVNLAGWHTRTTFDRLNEYSPFAFWRWRIRPKIDPETVISLDGGWRWYNRDKPGRRFILPEDSGKIRVHPDRRRVPYELGAYEDGDPVKLKSIERWEREWYEARDRERRARTKFTREKNKHRRRLAQVYDFICRNKLDDAMVRELCPRLETIEMQSRSLVTCAEARRTETEERLRETLREIEKVQRQKLALEDQLANAERERDEYMYQLDGLHYDMAHPPPEDRERSIVLEAP